MNKLKVFIIIVGFLMCFVNELKALPPVSDFTGLKDAIDDDNYDIELQSGVIYVWTSSPTIAQTGILRGTSGDTFAILDGDNKYQAFKFDGNRYAIFDGNFLFNKFKNNTSSGTVYVNASSVSFANGNVLFTSNTNTRGGAIYSVNSKILFSTITISFTSNTSVSTGAAIYAKGSNVDFTNASALFLKNKGTAIFIDNSNLNFTNTNVNFSSNSAAIGGAINSINVSQISFEGAVNFESNNAVSSGGAVFSRQTAIYFSRGIVNFTSNTAKFGGALYADTLTNTDFVNTTVRFVRNIALSSGGAVFIIDPSAGLPQHASIVNFTNSSILFSDNRAETGGGAALYAGGNTEIKLGNSLVNFSNNSAAGNGGSVFADNSRINFTNTRADFINNSGKLGGAVYSSNQSNIKFSQANFTGNTAVSSGGAIFIKDSSIEIQSGFFSQNTANDKPNDIHLAGNSTLIFAPAAAQSIVLEGGITSEGDNNEIRKRGGGDLIFTNNAELPQTSFGMSRLGSVPDVFIDFNGSFYIEEGKASFNISSGHVNSLSIGSGGILEIVLNYALPDSPFLYIDQLSVSPNSLLSLISLGDTASIGSSKTFMRIGNIDKPDIFGSIYDSKYIYSFDWTQDENGAWLAQAIIRAFRVNNVGLDGALYANLRTLAARTDFDFDFLGRQTDKKISFWTAGNFIGGAIIRERKSDDEFEIGDFGYDGTGVRLGFDFLSQGGIFFGYKHIDVHQRYDSWATGSDIEAGFYKIFDFRMAKLSFMTSYALQHFKAFGQTKVNGQAIRALGEAELGLFGSGGLRRGTSYQVSFFAQGRGAEIKSEKIYLKESADIVYEISAKDWIRLEILGGLKSEIKINELELMFKVYSGGATMGNRERFRWSQAERYGEIEASDEGDFFVGGALKAAYDLGNGVYLFTDAKIEKSIDAHNYGADIGVRYKFSGFRNVRRGSQAKVIGRATDYEIQEGALDNMAQEGYADRDDDTAAMIADALKGRQQSNSNSSVAMVTVVYVSSGNSVAVERPQREVITEPLELKQASAKEAQSVRNRAKKIFRLGNRSFGEDSTELTPKAKEEVRQLARQIKDLGFYRILVEGHTDDMTAGGNSLSSLRAQSILIELRANGIPSNRLSFIDMGSSKPLVSNKTSAGRANNRRVDIIVE